MDKEITKLINENDNRLVELNGKIKLAINSGGSFTVGLKKIKGIIQIERSGIVIDGKNAEIEVEISSFMSHDWALFAINSGINNVCIRNLNVVVKLQMPQESTRKFCMIYNNSIGTKIENCSFKMFTDKQINIVGIYNDGVFDTHVQTQADNVVIANNDIRVECLTEKYPFINTVYGIFNNFANSVSVQNNNIFVVNRGDSSSQQSIGIFNSGRYGRFVGNNIKANGHHNKGRLVEQAHAYGFINEGMYAVINANNIVGEWAGKSVGLKNTSTYVNISGNKILSSHTICGRTLCNTGSNCNINGNTILSNGRNAILILLNAANCIISNNMMSILMNESQCFSGCGIYACEEYNKGNIFIGNIINRVADCGIFDIEQTDIVENNIVSGYQKAIPIQRENIKQLVEKLDEKNIKSWII